MIIKCSFCGKKFNRKPYAMAKNNFCCNECRKLYMAKNSTRKLVICSFCGNEFYKKNSKVSVTNYCCRECFTKDKNINSHLKTGSIVKCSFCGNMHYKKKKEKENSNGNFFCSRDCLEKWLSNSNGVKRGSGGVCYIGYCKICGLIFNKRTKNSNQLYCSRECQHKGLITGKICFCKNCGESFWRRKGGIKESMFCSNDCRIIYQVGINNPNYKKDRTTLKNRNHSIRFSNEMNRWRLSIYERDDYTCQMCLAKSKPGSPVTLNAHHIKRFSDYPKLQTDVSNGITLCENCHKKTYFKEKSFECFFIRKVNEKNKIDKSTI